MVADLDQQGSAVFWAQTRGTNKPTVIDALPEKIPDILRAAPELGATLCMIATTRTRSPLASDKPNGFRASEPRARAADAPSRLDAVALAAIGGRGLCYVGRSECNITLQRRPRD
jgi:hypothetical protein